MNSVNRRGSIKYCHETQVKLTAFGFGSLGFAIGRSNFPHPRRDYLGYDRVYDLVYDLEIIAGRGKGVPEIHTLVAKRRRTDPKG